MEKSEAAAAQAWGRGSHRQGAVGAVTGLSLQGDSGQWRQENTEAWFQIPEAQLSQAAANQRLSRSRSEGSFTSTGQGESATMSRGGSDRAVPARGLGPVAIAEHRSMVRDGSSRQQHKWLKQWRNIGER